MNNSSSSWMQEQQPMPTLGDISGFKAFLQRKEAGKAREQRAAKRTDMSAQHSKPKHHQTLQNSNNNILVIQKPVIRKKVLLNSSHLNTFLAQATPKKRVKELDQLSSPSFGASAFSPGRPRISTAQSMQSPPPPISEYATSFSARSGRGKKELVFNDHITTTASRLESLVSIIPGQQTLGYRYMYERLTEKVCLILHLSLSHLIV
jgi:hypothetical protein